ncbi:hypothetical protein [Prauserella shujinwangii]|uniref:hypothetical protein n=1 Tax=Prauserella shujinwangii TaxID=1453103 RepID=UPI0011B294F8|nr:hypothetical protein [Prauserella shujinwangii]
MELPATDELGPITIAEAARHTAILGSCAAASVAPDDRRRYYLATHCDITWLATTPPADDDGFIGYATGGFRDPRKAYARTTLTTTTGRPVARVDVDYAAFTEEAFSKVFAHLHRPDLTPDPQANNPYTTGLPLHRLKRDGDTMCAEVRAAPGDCTGHFDNYPALPVAVLGESMTRLTSHLLDNENRTQSLRWLPRGLTFDARRLVPAGETVRLRARSLGPSPVEHGFHVSAGSADDTVAEMTMWLSPTSH